jgi:hypothetical protein
MLVAMDTTAAAATPAAPWLVLGLSLGALVVLLAGLGTALATRRGGASRPAAAPAAPPAAGYREDDLPGFLESPPGAAAAPLRTGWAALATTPVVPDPPSPEPLAHRRRDTVVVLTAMAVTALLLVGAAAAIAATSRSPEAAASRSPDPASPPPGGPGVAARLTFGGVVLEQRAVGVTATYPVLEVAADGGSSEGREARVHVEFPTFNCLTGEAPVDPVAAGCTRSVTEYADVTSPDVVVAREGDVLRISGRFPTRLQPNGGPPVPTGRVYELRVTVSPTDGRSPDGWRPAEGVLELGSDRADTVDEAGVSVLRSGS